MEETKMEDLIRRQNAIDLLEKLSDGYDYIETETESAIEAFKKIPSIQPCTEKQIQAMQDLEQAQLDKAYELGRKDGRESFRRNAIELVHSLYPSAPIVRMNRERWKEKYKPYIEVEKMLEMLPSAQPEIIRCKECKWHLTYHDEEYNIGYELCSNPAMMSGGSMIDMSNNDFCSKAERRTDVKADKGASR